MFNKQELQYFGVGSIWFICINAYLFLIENLVTGAKLLEDAMVSTGFTWYWAIFTYVLFYAVPFLIRDVGKHIIKYVTERDYKELGIMLGIHAVGIGIISLIL